MAFLIRQETAERSGGGGSCAVLFYQIFVSKGRILADICALCAEYLDKRLTFSVKQL